MASERDEKATRLRTDGARALRRWLDNPHRSRGREVAHQGVPDFCEEHGLDRLTVQRALTGERKRISVDFAAAVERATGGSVPWTHWLRKTARAENARRPSTPPRSAA